ncbi:GNAT family N-acetyltransferase [Actinacidiphila alni]|uniref:GNAT family N-acetyltransferase n=1 Tax=Actinacidiphila alni TaxID=380248 RepID=UPI0033F35D4A
MDVILREIRDSDLPVFFAHGQDPESVRMAAFTHEDPADRAAFDAHWARIRALPDVLNRTVVAAASPDEILGHVAVYGPPDEREVTYWIGRSHWGRGAATAALRSLLLLAPERPLHARAASDNAASLRVLQKCGFVVTGTDRGYAAGRGEEIEETLLTLKA